MSQGGPPGYSVRLSFGSPVAAGPPVARPEEAEAALAAGDAARAEQLYREILERGGASVPLLNGLARALDALGRREAALAVYDQALALGPDVWQLHYNRGNALAFMDRHEAALEAYDRAVALAPEAPEPLAARAAMLHVMGRFEAAMADVDRAVAVAPDHLTALWNRAQLRLHAGDYEGGWRDFEQRFRLPAFVGNRLPPGERWTGAQPLAGRRVMIQCEQGFGDTLMMLRYAALAAAQGAHVSAVVQPPLAEIARSASGLSEVAAVGGAYPAYDVWAPAMSLPLAFGTTVETVPRDIPYLTAPEAAVRRWAERLSRKRGLRVGLVWSGRPTALNDRRRVGFAALAPLFETDAEFVSLQAEYWPEDAEAVRAEPRLRDVSGELTSFAETAGLMANLDLIVSIDTAAAHLAGALGRPLIVLLAKAGDFRWGPGDHAVWYPQARTIRQDNAGDWAPVIARAAAEIGRLSGPPPSSS